MSQPAKPRFTRNQVNGKKTKSSCWDCGQQGHWSGDHGCPNPGAGLYKPKNSNPKPQKQVRVVEALTTELSADPTAPADEAHEVLTLSRVSRPSTLSEALRQSNEVHVSQLASLSMDKRLMGALDSACNRTCCGTACLDHYFTALNAAPQEIKCLVQQCPEQETFRFGDGGTQSSYRIRAPATGPCPCRRLYTLAAPAADPFVRPRGYLRSTPGRPPPKSGRQIYMHLAQDVQKRRFLQCFVAFGGYDFRLTGRRWCRLCVPRGQA